MLYTKHMTMSRKAKRTLIIVVALVAVILTALVLCPVCALATAFLGRDFQPYTEVAKIDVGNQRVVTLYAESCWEVSRGIYYDAREASRLVIPRTLLDFDQGFDQYSLTGIYAENDSLVGIAAPPRSKEDFIIIIDFKNSKSWPAFSDDYATFLKKGRELYARLVRENPGLPELKRLNSDRANQ
jgi:hypothetical protein